MYDTPYFSPLSRKTKNTPTTNPHKIPQPRIIQRALIDWAQISTIIKPSQGLSSHVFFVKLNDKQEYVLKFPFENSVGENERMASSFIAKNTNSLLSPRTRLISMQSTEVEQLEAGIKRHSTPAARELLDVLLSHPTGEFICMEKMSGRSLDFMESTSDRKLLADPSFQSRLGEVLAFDLLMGNIDRLLLLNPDNLIYDLKKRSLSLIDQKVSIYDLSGVIPHGAMDTEVLNTPHASEDEKMEAMLQVNAHLKEYLEIQLAPLKNGEFGKSSISEKLAFMFETQYQARIDRRLIDIGLYEGLLKIAQNFHWAGAEAMTEWSKTGVEGMGLFHNWLTVSDLLPDAQQSLASLEKNRKRLLKKR
ncbi:hypothetical protein [Aureibacter tunicatorum]|uniref:Actin-fragmin kinase catalytic domain-containing protein n=1 Tax=Aureibacter tunicatorum TaxID=866807 RepID=A0AAE3XPV0_9BACT|nr:hypothetical protein [Aureibacter tunicatorum]MDR6240367.1 hypothetical protein [Aureibacter tunicatorum]